MTCLSHTGARDVISRSPPGLTGALRLEPDVGAYREN